MRVELSTAIQLLFALCANASAEARATRSANTTWRENLIFPFCISKSLISARFYATVESLSSGFSSRRPSHPHIHQYRVLTERSSRLRLPERALQILSGPSAKQRLIVSATPESDPVAYCDVVGYVEAENLGPNQVDFEIGLPTRLQSGCR